jgi:hypothetical protein
MIYPRLKNVTRLFRGLENIWEKYCTGSQPHCGDDMYCFDGAEEEKVVSLFQMIFVRLENITIMLLGSNNSRNTFFHVPI